MHKHFVFLFRNMHSMVGIKGCSAKTSFLFPSDLLDGLSKKFVSVGLVNQTKRLHEPQWKRHHLLSTSNLITI